MPSPETDISSTHQSGTYLLILIYYHITSNRFIILLYPDIQGNSYLTIILLLNEIDHAMT